MIYTVLWDKFATVPAVPMDWSNVAGLKISWIKGFTAEIVDLFLYHFRPLCDANGPDQGSCCTNVDSTGGACRTNEGDCDSDSECGQPGQINKCSPVGSCSWSGIENCCTHENWCLEDSHCPADFVCDSANCHPELTTCCRYEDCAVYLRL